MKIIKKVIKKVFSEGQFSMKYAACISQNKNKGGTTMKRVLAIVLALSMISASSSFAASASSPTYTMKATMADEITIVVKWFKTNTDPAPANQITGTTIDWGNLVFDSANTVFNNDMARLALITANNHSRSYVVTQTGTNLISGSNAIPANCGTPAHACYKVSPSYVASDNGGVTEGTIGAVGTANATNKTLFTSGGVHGLRVIRAYYSLTDIPADLPVGTYQGTLTFTITG